MPEFVKDLDRQISVLSEELARNLNRRRFLINGVKGLAAAAAAVSIGGLTNLREVFAVTCTCNWINGSGNSNCPHWSYPCPTYGGCPSGCSFCTINDLPRGSNGFGCYGWCNYSGGQWISCNNLCNCGNGYRVCSDCKCSTCNGYLCTCLSSGVICCGCCTPQEVQAEMAKQHLN